MQSLLTEYDTLEVVELRDDRYNDQNPPERVIPFLIAIQENPRIHTVKLTYLHFSRDMMAAFLDDTRSTSVTTLELALMPGMEGGAEGVAAALPRNTHIQRLKLDAAVNSRDRLLILHSLGSNCISLKELGLSLVSSKLSLAESQATKDRLASTTTTIQQFTLCGGDFGRKVMVDTFRPIVQGLVCSNSVTAVQIRGVTFDGLEEVLLLNSILESKSNLQSLTLEHCSLHEDGRESFRTAIVSLL
jgi:hypothetical protein